jgi:hypothetical protein
VARSYMRSVARPACRRSCGLSLSAHSSYSMRRVLEALAGGGHPSAMRTHGTEPQRPPADARNHAKKSPAQLVTVVLLSTTLPFSTPVASQRLHQPLRGDAEPRALLAEHPFTPTQARRYRASPLSASRVARAADTGDRSRASCQTGPPLDLAAAHLRPRTSRTRGFGARAPSELGRATGIRHPLGASP